MEINLKTQKVLTYDDVVAFQPGSSLEPLVNVQKYSKTIVAQYIKEDMLPHTGESIYIRETLAIKLAAINARVNKLGYMLKIVYGYRHPDVQQSYFFTRRAVLASQYPEYNDEQLDRLTHNYVAVPDVAGHPAGAAVDLTLVDNDGNELDMGTEIADYSDPEKIRTFSARLTSVQEANRKLLHDAMIEEYFAPFYGEWWHFSYGDREWAAFYNKKALYGAMSVYLK